MLRIHQINRFSEMKWVRFQRNCGTASVEEYNRIICFYQLSWLCKFATVKSWKADVLETLYGDQFTLSTQLIKNKLSNFQRWPNKVNTERFLIYHNLGTEEKKALLPIRKQLQTSLENNRQKTPPNGFTIDNFSQTVNEWARWEKKRKENEVSHFGKHI